MANKCVQATELEWLHWFYDNADFGPADWDVRLYIQSAFEKKTGKRIPSEYRMDVEDGAEE